MTRISRTLKISILACLVFVITTVIATSLWLDPYVKSHLNAWVGKASDNKYALNVSDVNIHLWSRSVTLTDLHVTPQHADSNGHAHEAGLFLDAAQLDIEGIGIWQLLTGNQVHCSRLGLIRPAIRIVSEGKTKQADAAKKDSKKLRTFSVDLIEIIQPYLAYAQKGKGTTRVACTGGITVNDWVLSEEGQRRHHIADYIECSSIDVQGLACYQQETLYRYALGRLTLNREEGGFTLRDLSVKPAFSYREFYRRLGYQQMIYNLQLPLARMEQLDWQAFADSNQLMAGKLLLGDMDVNMYFSRLEAPGPKDKMGEYPGQLLLKAPFPLCVKQVEVKNLDVGYRELSSFTKHEGAVRFDAITGTISNVTNMPVHLKKNPHCVARLHGQFGKSYAHMTFNFLVTAKDGSFTSQGAISRVNENQVNPVFIGLGGVGLESFDMHQLKVYVAGNEDNMHGHLTMLYDSLKLDLKPHSDKRVPVISFLVDKLVYEANAMPGKDVRHVQMSMDRDPDRPYFHQLWWTVFTGIQKTALHTQKLPDNVNFFKKKFRQWFRKKRKA